jgi:hypothetical protein
LRNVRGRCYGWVSVLSFLATLVPSLSHDGWALTVDEVALLKGPDRQKVLEEGFCQDAEPKAGWRKIHPG